MTENKLFSTVKPWNLLYCYEKNKTHTIIFSQKIEVTFCSAGTRSCSSAKSIEDDKTKKRLNLVIDKGVQCNKEKSMTVNDITIEAEGSGEVFGNFQKSSVALIDN